MDLNARIGHKVCSEFYLHSLKHLQVMFLCHTYTFRSDFCIHMVEWAHRNNFLPLTFHLLKLFLLQPLSHLKGDRMMSPMRFRLIRLDANRVTFCVSAFGRQLHFPSQPWSGRSHLSAMWGKMTPLRCCFSDCKSLFSIQTSFFILSQSFKYRVLTVSKN